MTVSQWVRPSPLLRSGAVPFFSGPLGLHSRRMFSREQRVSQMTTFPTKVSLLLAGLAILLAASVGAAREPIAKAKIKTYTPWQAAWDAHARSEQARLSAIDRQRQTNDLMSWYGTYSPGYYRPAPRGLGQRGYERRLSKSPIHMPFPGSPGLAYPNGRKVVPTLPYLNPSPPPVVQPVGHRKTLTSSNSYIYRPLYASDQDRPEEAIPAALPRPPVSEEIPVLVPAHTVPAPVPSEPIPTPPALPEAIPTPAPQ
jgi:hypothetical protein